VEAFGLVKALHHRRFVDYVDLGEVAAKRPGVRGAELDVEVEDCHLRAGGREPLGGSSAKAGGAAGHDRR